MIQYYLRVFLGLSALAIPLVSVSTAPSLAQRQGAAAQFPLMSNADCSAVVPTSGVTFMYAEENGQVPIGLQLYDYFYWMRAPEGTSAALVCNIDPVRFDTLTLQMGVSDNRRNEFMTVNIHQSGTVISTYNSVGPGDLVEATIDLTNADSSRPGSVAIEIFCDRGGTSPRGCYFHLLEGVLAASDNYL